MPSCFGYKVKNYIILFSGEVHSWLWKISTGIDHCKAVLCSRGMRRIVWELRMIAFLYKSLERLHREMLGPKERVRGKQDVSCGYF